MEYFISFGSNINKDLNIKKMLEYIKKDFPKVKISSLYATKPWGNLDQEDFLNGVLSFKSPKDPLSILEFLQGIEWKLKRVRTTKWGPRTIDLDIIFALDEDKFLEVENEKLKIPHPYFWDRLFVLEPLLDIYPDFKYNGQSLIDRIDDLKKEDDR